MLKRCVLILFFLQCFSLAFAKDSLHFDDNKIGMSRAEFLKKKPMVKKVDATKYEMKNELGHYQYSFSQNKLIEIFVTEVNQKTAQKWMNQKKLVLLEKSPNVDEPAEWYKVAIPDKGIKINLKLPMEILNIEITKPFKTDKPHQNVKEILKSLIEPEMKKK